MTAPLPRLAEYPDVLAWPGVDADAAQPGVEFLLDIVSGLIRLEPGAAGLWPDAGTIPAAIKGVAVAAVARALDNPTAAAMITTGPFSEQHAQGIEDAVYLTGVEKRTVGAAIKRPALWTLSTWRDEVYASDDLVFTPSTGYRDPFVETDTFGPA